MTELKAEALYKKCDSEQFDFESRLGSTAKAIIREADKPILVLKKDLRLDKTITAIYDTSEESQKGLRAALSLARKNESELSVIVMSNNRQGNGKRDKKLEQMVDSTSVAVSVMALRNAGMEQFLNAVNRQQAGLLIMAKNHPLLQGEALNSILVHLNCPVLLMA